MKQDKWSLSLAGVNFSLPDPSIAYIRRLLSVCNWYDPLARSADRVVFFSSMKYACAATSHTTRFACRCCIRPVVPCQRDTAMRTCVRLIWLSLLVPNHISNTNFCWGTMHFYTLSSINWHKTEEFPWKSVAKACNTNRTECQSNKKLAEFL